MLDEIKIPKKLLIKYFRFLPAKFLTSENAKKRFDQYKVPISKDQEDYPEE
jgi:hypothetical protein